MPLQKVFNPVVIQLGTLKMDLSRISSKYFPANYIMVVNLKPLVSFVSRNKPKQAKVI